MYKSMNTATTMQLRNRLDLNVPNQNMRHSSQRYEVEGAKLWNEYGSKLSTKHTTLAKFKRAVWRKLLAKKE